MAKKVLLINPPESGMGEHSFPPLGLLYVAGVLQKENVQVKIIDGFLDGWQGIESSIRDYKPDIVGMTCHTYARVQVLKIAKLAKEILRGVTVVVGGAHPTIMARQMLENYTFIDVVAIGEADYTLLDICRGRDYSEIPGIGYRHEDKVIINPERKIIDDLDSVPFPAWNLLDLKRYPPDGEGVYRGIDLEKEPCIPILFSRGCVGNCNFCSNRLMWKRWRHRSPTNTLDELELLNKKFSIKHFVFIDDCFSVNKKATIELCRGIAERKLNIVFDIVTRTDCVDDEVLQALKDAGCYQINYGIETASPRLLKIMGKPVGLEISEKAIKLTNSHGIRSTALFIAGCVGETAKTINETIDFLNRTDPSRIGVGKGLMIFPGTRLYNLAKEKGFISDDFWLTDYTWKVYTLDNSRMWLNIFGNALEKRQKLSRFSFINLIRNHRFVSREFRRQIQGDFRA
ncbi:MAG: B12-binding domain-containing radical SAM protein [Candidatus Omnitrophica bacterium]|nr:B12-binding domain-containing radical SAM protein [Candidatus Omnitrophota bacterium]MBU4590203.1 B12-binding domain-containing radical SAM protein [Candidatus Omnitrophota bacterium]